MKSKQKIINQPSKVYRNLFVQSKENINPNVNQFQPNYQQNLFKQIVINPPPVTNRTMNRIDPQEFIITEEVEPEKQKIVSKELGFEEKKKFSSLQLISKLNLNKSNTLAVPTRKSTSIIINHKSIISQKRNKLQEYVQKMLSSQRIKQQLSKKDRDKISISLTKNQTSINVQPSSKQLKILEATVSNNKERKSQKQATLSKYLAQKSMITQDQGRQEQVLTHQLILINNMIDEIFNMKSERSSTNRSFKNKPLTLVGSIRHKLQQVLKGRLSNEQSSMPRNNFILNDI